MKQIVLVFILSLCNVMAWGASNDGTPPAGKNVAGDNSLFSMKYKDTDVMLYYKKTGDEKVSVYWVDRDNVDVYDDDEMTIEIPGNVFAEGRYFDVTAIEAEAFRAYSSDGETVIRGIGSIVLPSSIVSIGKDAFKGLALNEGLVLRSNAVPAVDGTLGALSTGKKITISVPIDLMYLYEQNELWNQETLITNALVKMNVNDDGSSSNWISVCSYKPLACSDVNDFAAFKAVRMNKHSEDLNDKDEPDNSVMLKWVTYIPEGEGVWIHRGRFVDASKFEPSSLPELSIPIYIKDYPEYSAVTPAPMVDNLLVGSWKSPTEEKVVTINGASGYTDYALSKSDDKAHKTAANLDDTKLSFCKAILRMPNTQGAKAATLSMFIATDDDATSITPAFKYDVTSGNIYSISGSQLPKNSKGLQIVNGKKIYKK